MLFSPKLAFGLFGLHLTAKNRLTATVVLFIPALVDEKMMPRGLDGSRTDLCGVLLLGLPDHTHSEWDGEQRQRAIYARSRRRSGY